MKSMKEFTVIVLAAGKGKRMKSSIPKVLQDLRGKPLIYYVLRELLDLEKSVKQIIVVLGHKGKMVEEEIKKYFFAGDKRESNTSKIHFVCQSQTLGTANAVESARKKIKYNNVVVTCGDVPLITSETISSFIQYFLRKKLNCCVLTAELKQKNTLGVILRDENSKIMAIKEKIGTIDNDRESLRQKSYHGEVNSGVYCFQKGILLDTLPNIKKNKKKQEFFLTDIVEIFYKQGCELGSFLIDDSDEILGINTQKDLNIAEKIMRDRVLEGFMDEKVRIIDPSNTFIEDDVKIGKNTVIYPFTFIDEGVIIGKNCSLGPFVRLRPGTGPVLRIRSPGLSLRHPHTPSLRSSSSVCS